jgi:integrase
MKKHKSKAKGPLETVTEKGVNVHLYSTPTTKAGKVYPGHTLIYTAAGKRKREFVADLEKARTRAKEIAAQLGEGIGHAHVLSATQAADTIAALQAVRPLGRTVTLAEIATDYVAAAKMLPEGATLRDAVTHYSRHVKKQDAKTRVSVTDVVTKFIAAKEADDLSTYYLKPLGRILDRFKASFQCPIGDVEADQILEWLNAQKVSKRTRRNLRNSIATLFSFARDQGHLPEEQRTAAERVKIAKDKDKTITTYTPGELAKIMAAAPERLVPAIAIAALAGIRSAELLRLDWKHVNVAKRHIILPPEVTKTASRRVVPIAPALADWLRPHVQKEGHVTPPYQNLDNLTRGMIETVETAGIKPLRNGFRHSFGTYRLAVTQSAAQTSLEMGNSARKLSEHYNAAATKAEGRRWFNVKPPGKGKVVPFKAATAA